MDHPTTRTGVSTVTDIGEDALVRRISRKLAVGKGVIAGAGDDCAVLRLPGKGRVSLFKTDCIVEGVHFTSETPATLVGRKALGRVLSDIAAMGGVPHYAVITLMLPGATPVRYVDGLYNGMNALATRFGVSIVGGETSSAPLVSITVALLGSASAKGWVGRDGAKAGDEIFVTGRLGGSLMAHHLKFEPRLAEGQWLAQHARPHAMMDLSDGLAKDLPRLALASHVGFEVDFEALPVRRGCNARQAWGDGEDYELLLALPPKRGDHLIQKWRQRFPAVPLTRIGRFVPEGASAASAPPGGWDHFPNPQSTIRNPQS
jgi:thiamine-monophosphate kinase